MSEAEKIAELENIIQNYTIFFLIFDVLFFVTLITIIIFAIRFLKSKKNLQESNEFLLYTIKGQEEERSRISRELHDTVAQDLRYIKSLCDKKDKKSFQEISTFLTKTLQQIRLVSYNLFPSDIKKNDFKQSLVNLCNYLSEINKIKIKLSIIENTDFNFLTENDILNLYRIIQEAITNSIKHSDANEVVILIRNQTGTEQKGLYIFISDDGKGFDPSEDFNKCEKHFGIISMKKRSQLISCDFKIISAKDEGTQIYIFKSSEK